MLMFPENVKIMQTKINVNVSQKLIECVSYCLNLPNDFK